MLRLLTAVTHVATAFDKDGHDAIGMIATNGLDFLNPRGSFDLKKLLGKGDASDAGYWTHAVEESAHMSDLTSLHFQGQSDVNVCRADHCPTGHCLSKAVKALYSQLIGDPVVENPLPSGLTLTDSDAAKFIIAIIGDIHQPMHVSRIATDYGRKDPMIMSGKPGTTNMFDVWESDMTQQETKGSNWWSGWTQISGAVTFQRDQRDFASKGISLVDDWIAENANFACTKIFPQIGKPIDAAKNMSWRRELRQQLMMAGARVAIVLNSILVERAKRGTKSVRGGSAFAPLPESDFMLEAVIVSESGAALFNLFVFGLVLLFFALLIRQLNNVAIEKDKKDREMD